MSRRFVSGVIMKTAVIFYSFEGHSARIAENIKAAANADIYEIKTTDTKKRTGFSKYVWGGGQVVRGKKPPILPLQFDPGAYDLIILGTPVWAGSPAPALLSFLDKTAIKGKKIALFCCHGGGKGKVFEKLKARLPGNNFAGEIDFQFPSNDDSAAIKQKIDEWVKSIGC